MRRYVPLLFVVGIGCTGLLGGDPPGGEDGDGDCVGCDEETAAAASIVSSRFPRLSHAQWENTVRDLFFLDDVTGLSASFIGDPLGGAFDNNERSLSVTPKHWEDYQTAAEEVSLLVTSDPALLARIVPSDLPTDPAERIETWVTAFGLRAYRRPLSSEEIADYVGLFALAPDLWDDADAFTLGVRLAIQAFVQSPHFLYRAQWSTDVVEHLIPLDGYELATKLSYMLWNTMPDDVLFDSAAAGELDDEAGVLAAAERMLEDPRSRETVRSFHAQLYNFEDFREVYKDEALFPNFDPAVGEDMEHEAEMFVEEVVFADNGGLRELLTASHTYVNADLADLYGLEGTFDDTFVRVELDPETRSGLLTRLGFLASHATAKEQHSIERGVFINRRILCANLPAPPNNIPPPPSGSWDTNRERVEAYTGEGTCGVSCHGAFINPAGFAFEHYDAIGAYQTMENGVPINAADTYPFEVEGDQTYDGANEFMDLVVNAEQTHRCYSSFMLEYAYGRDFQEGDTVPVDDLTEASPTGSVKDLFLALTQTKAFRTRAPEVAE